MPQDTPIVVFVATYPPRECGIATFTKNLLTSSQKIFGKDMLCRVAAMNVSEMDTQEYPKEVIWQINQDNKADYRKVAMEINKDPNIKGVILQHEYGIYGGEWGENILQFIKNCRKPLLVTLHTVLPDPTEKMRAVTEEIVREADRIVVLTNDSKRILEEVYPEARGKTKVIPHGIHYRKFSTTTNQKKQFRLGNRTVLSTFGLLSRGKGIEYVIRALPKVVKKHPEVKYLILGKTHPVIRRKEGEKYRLELLELVTKLKLQKYVKFYDQYLSVKELLDFLEATDIYICTSLNPNQAVSGTLSYALGAGRAVVSTSFPQAREIVTEKTGVVVPIGDAKAMSTALLKLLAEPKKLGAMHKEAYRVTRPMLWNNVAAQYYGILEEIQPKNTQLILPAIDLTHLKRMTDNVGLFQFAKYSKPDKRSGYTVDDNARALMVATKLWQYKQTPLIFKLIKTYLSFLSRFATEKEMVVNYVNFNKQQATAQNLWEDVEESQSRALWGLATVLGTEELPEELRVEAKKTMRQLWPQAQDYSYLRSQATAVKALEIFVEKIPEIREESSTLIKKYARNIYKNLRKNSDENWVWFEPSLIYNNGVLVEALLIAGKILERKDYQRWGMKALKFLVGATFSGSIYVPIGNQAWFSKGGKRSLFDQQPEDPAATIMALNEAFEQTKKIKYRQLAKTCFSWYLGNNMLRLALYNPIDGSCFDGLQEDKVNLNEGAESLVSYLLARLTVAQMINTGL